MAAFAQSDDLRGAEFAGTDLRGARFIEADLSDVVMRGVRVAGADIDAPWLCDGESFLRVNGVDVIPLVEAELNRRLPGRAGRRAPGVGAPPLRGTRPRRDRGPARRISSRRRPDRARLTEHDFAGGAGQTRAGTNPAPYRNSGAHQTVTSQEQRAAEIADSPAAATLIDTATPVMATSGPQPSGGRGRPPAKARPPARLRGCAVDAC